MTRQSRRSFLRTSLGALGVLALPTPALPAEGPSRRPKLPVAGIATVYRQNSHAHVILGKIVEGYNQDGGPGPDLELVSMYIDQLHNNDMGRALAKKHGFRLAKSIDEAITLGGDKVEVAGVLSIGEHGNYPSHPVTGQQMYPRKRFFDEIVTAFRRGGKVVPVFNDKHLSHSTKEALAMYRTAKEMKIPFMAGSSVPVAWRVPPVDLPLGCEIEGAVAIGFGGNEAYGFHTLEMLQSQVERRQGGETGVKTVRAVKGRAVLDAEKEGYWSPALLAAALEPAGGKLGTNFRKRIFDRPFYLIDYRDGLKAAVAMGIGAGQFSFAAKIKGRDAPMGAWFETQNGPPYRHFEWLVKAIEPMVHTGKPSYPVERTLITTGILDAAMNSLAQTGAPIETPDMNVSYRAVHWPHAPGRPPKPRAW